MNIGFAGDWVLQDLPLDQEYIFQDIHSVLEREGIKLCINLESPFVPTGTVAIKNKLTLHAPPEAISYIKYLSPYLVNIGNNHINDSGNIGSQLTLDLLDKENIKYFGAGYTNDDFEIFIQQEDKVIFLAYVLRSSDLTGSPLFCQKDFIGGRTPDFKQIAMLKQQHPDYKLIVNLHWGFEDIRYPEPQKRKLAYELIDNGADLIIGHHAHIIQPYEVYRNKMIFYSLGNFYFSDIHFTEDNVDKIKKSRLHQKRGIIPIFNTTSSNIKLVDIYQIYVSGKRLRIRKNYQLKKLSKMTNCYICKHALYLKCIQIKEKIRYIIDNPWVILNKFGFYSGIF